MKVIMKYLIIKWKERIEENKIKELWKLEKLMLNKDKEKLIKKKDLIFSWVYELIKFLLNNLFIHSFINLFISIIWLSYNLKCHIIDLLAEKSGLESQ